MNDKLKKFMLNDPDLQSKLDQLKQQLLAQAPEHVRRLGKILRKRSVFFMHRYLKKLGLGGKIKKSELPLFMDWLITQRIDLKDMEPDARRNLRKHTLEEQPITEQTNDYRSLENPEEHTCKECRWFREVPFGDEKDCVELGAKGTDAVCYGFTNKIMA